MRIGFTPGDRVFWAADCGPFRGFRGGPETFGEYLAHVAETEGVTDMVMLGDGRPYHKAAIAALHDRSKSIVPWIIEQGYLRPGLIRVETWGTGGRSAIPGAFAGNDDTPALRERQPAPATFLRYAAFDTAYHAVNVTLGPLLFPGYRHHALDSPWAEWRGWIGKGATQVGRVRMTREGVARIAAHAGPVFLLPLQLDTDFQLRDHGTGRSQTEELDGVLASFSAQASSDALLAVKEHPLDNGLRRWSRTTRRLAERHGIADRVVFLPGGRVESLFPKIAGVVTINSTVGLSALLEGCPVKVLGTAIYDRPGLTHQAGLGSFWRDAARPDPDIAGRFRRFLRYHFHVPGAFDGPDAVTGSEHLARFIAGERPQ